MGAPNLQFAHVGINCKSESDAMDAADLLGCISGAEIRVGSSSVFSGTEIEITKDRFPGAHGHLAFSTHDIDTTIRELGAKGVRIVEGSQKYKENKLVAVYLDVEVAGFAVHLLAKS
jgi:2-dehydro-3-deoxyphosphogluconate aldolase / (4S)-4-hydroxy-2-oxoglutarate aldolase